MTKHCKHKPGDVYCFYCKLKEHVPDFPEDKMLDALWQAHLVRSEPYSGVGCNACSMPDEPYMLQDTVWRQARKKGERFLCLGCVRKRLGRNLVTVDFKTVPINYAGMGPFDCRAYIKNQSRPRKAA